MAVDSEADDAGLARNLAGQRVPVPDPTVLTTQALYREVQSLQELVELRIAGVALRLDQTAIGINQQMELIQREREERFGQLHAEIEAAVEARNILDTEKDKRVTQQFDLIERQRVEQKADTKAAVDAALTAQKEAVKEQTAASEKAIAKSETSINKLVEQLGSSFTLALEAQRREVTEIKERISEVQADLRASISIVDTKANAQVQQKAGGADSRAMIGWALAAVISIVAIVGFVVDLVAR